MHAGRRGQDYDLEITGRVRSGVDPYLRAVGLSPGRYEVKALWRKNERCSFDRRFKVGHRGERIYGKRDAEIKSFALAQENYIESILDNTVQENDPPLSSNRCTQYTTEIHDFVDLALERKHSKRFNERLKRIAQASLLVPSLSTHARMILAGGVQATDIVKGFSDIEGIFVVAGDIYTLITKDEMADHLAFDSASSEGLRIRLVSVIPSVEQVRQKRS